MAEKQAEFWTFPTNLNEFDQDDRISYSKLDNKYIAVQEDGTEYEFDTGLKRWIPIIDEALIQEQQKGYIQYLEGQDDDDEQMGPAQGKKRKSDKDREDSNGRSSKQARRNRAPQPKQNTAVYVTGLPEDVTVDEVAEVFSRKAGVIAEEIDKGGPRIKLYHDEDGKFKGDALIVFFKPPSVDLAITLLDDTDFRYPPSGPKMHVQAADSSFKKTTYKTTAPGEGGGGPKTTSSITGAGTKSGENNSDSAATPSDTSAPSNRAQDKAKIIRKTQKLDAKLADWDDDEPVAILGKAAPYTAAGNPAKKADKTVILRHMFTLAELDEDPAALLDIVEDVRDECSKFGTVTSVVLYDEEEEGIMTVRFTTPEAAEMCLHKLHGRKFDQRTVEAFFATGKEKFKKSSDRVQKDADDE
ncbi:hypothetical protein B0H63DRAFT_457028 [Podospora didyma]|uniref:RRM domain-containing protein n=1 Tax=Podospora didyma TaxID=330526 RepID=A0AAE0U776_9PEZI|nr:hypothetical protein B0H63DRAFT_457028 [Podospora didyma]